MLSAFLPCCYCHTFVNFLSVMGSTSSLHIALHITNDSCLPFKSPHLISSAITGLCWHQHWQNLLTHKCKSTHVNARNPGEESKRSVWEKAADCGMCSFQVARWFTLTMMLMRRLVVDRGTLPFCLCPSASVTQWGPLHWQQVHQRLTSWFKGHCEQDVGPVAHMEHVLPSRIWSTSRINASPRVNGL